MTTNITALERKRDELIAYRNTLNLHRLNTLLTEKSKPKKLHTSATYNHSIDLIQKHSKLPVIDINRRLQYAKLTCPWMNVENILKLPNPDSSRSKLSFILKFEECCILEVVIYINNLEQTIQNLKIEIKDLLPIDEEPIIRKLVEEVIKSFDLSLLVYRMNTLLRMRHKRKRIWMSVFEDIDVNKLVSINGFPLNAKSSKATMAAVLFDHSPSLVVFKTKKSVLNISWNIVFNSKNRHCVSEFTATVKNKNITKLFTSLIKSKDLKLATLQLLDL